MFAPGKDQISWSAERRRLFEQSGVMTLDDLQMVFQGRHEISWVRLTHEGGEPVELLIVFWKGVSLPILYHLQSMFRGPQKNVCFLKFTSGLRRNPVRRSESSDCVERWFPAEAVVASPIDQLLGLGKEFDFSDAAATEFQIVPQGGDPAATSIGVDLALDGVDILYRGEIQIATPYEWAELIEKRAAGLSVAANEACLDHRCPFPILTHTFIIGFRCIDR